jgi:uncharacterized protein (TIGR02186 family)
MISGAVPQPPPDPPAAVSAALTTTRVEVSSNFRGASIVLYGAVEGARPGDVVVVVRGPVQPVRIVRRVQVAGLWLNSRPVLFEGAPGFYEAAATRPLHEIADFATLNRLRLGVDHLAIEAPQEARAETRYGVRDMVVNTLGADYLDWLNALVRLKEKDRLYEDAPRGVRFVDRGLFRAEISLPADAPVGRYQADVFLFQGGRVAAMRSRTLEVEKIGFERQVWVAAHRFAWLYGLGCVLLGLGSGWLASRLFRRN